MSVDHPMMAESSRPGSPAPAGRALSVPGGVLC
jgi:hypothetical protein